MSGSDFTKIWIIENLYMCPKQCGEFIKCKKFDTKIFHETKWCIVLFPKGARKDDEEYISCFLQREDDEELENIEIEFEISLNSDIAKMKHNFQKDERWGFHKFLKREPWNRFHENSFVLKCHMRMISDNLIKTKECMSIGSTSKISKEISSVIGAEELMTLDKKLVMYPNQCSERCSYEVRRRIVKCPIEDIILPTIKRDQQILITLCTPWLMFLITIGYDLEDNVDHVQIKIRLKDKLPKENFTICKVDLLDSNNEIHSSAEDNHIFKANSTNDIWHFQHPFQWKDLKAMDSGSIRFEFIKSLDLVYKDAGFEVNIERSLPVKIEKPSSLKKETFRFYKERKFCDISLDTTEKSFKVHKTVLAAMSPVFDAMFASNMSEAKCNIVHIDDLDSDTVSRLVDFMYTESIELLECESTMKLFSAADKYQIMSLKNVCRNFLKNNISVQNVCPILSFADTHNDEILKKSIISYIYSKKNDVLCSSQWKIFADRNTRTALEILQEVCLKSSCTSEFAA